MNAQIFQIPNLVQTQRVMYFLSCRICLHVVW